MRHMILAAAILIAACGDQIPSRFSIVSSQLDVQGDNGFMYHVTSTRAPGGACFVTLIDAKNSSSELFSNHPIPNHAWMGFNIPEATPDSLVVHCIGGEISGEIAKAP